jgi:dihydropteroate synthase
VIAAPRPHFSIPLKGRAPLVLGPRTLVMGVINVTPDSFSSSSSGGPVLDAPRALDLALAMEAAGADLIDVGAESTRPGAQAVGANVEMSRVRPVIHALAAKLTIPISIDTYKASVAQVAIDVGAALVNDISALEYDPALGSVVAASGVPIVLMHTRGRPNDMYEKAIYGDVVAEVAAELTERIDRAVDMGIGRDRLILDPGIGFAKKAEHSWATLAGLDRLHSLGRPLLMGVSRKSFLTKATGPLEPADRDWASAAAVTASILAGAHIIRVHRVAEMVQVARVADAIRAVTTA